jgi:hypothetical protein
MVGRSRTEAQFRAMTHWFCELLWLKILLKELGYNSKDHMRLYCDNKAVINIVHNPMQDD